MEQQRRGGTIPVGEIEIVLIESNDSFLQQGEHYCRVAGNADGHNSA